MHAIGFPEEPQELRPSGIDVVGAVPWGTHFCQFYATSQDLVETLVPYFRAGLAANDFCMWVTSAPLQVEQALAALRAAEPRLEDYLARGQLEVLDYTQWYTRTGQFDADLVLQGWTDKLNAARQRGFEGLRLTGNTFWLEQATWEDFTRYEEKVNSVIGGQRMIALCTYSLEKCGVREVMDVVANHQFALIKTAGTWEIFESTEHAKTEQALRVSEARYRSLFTQIQEGFALHEIVCDPSGKPVDYRFLDVNPAFEQFTGLSRDRVVGRTVLEVLPDTEPYWIETYGQVALTGDPVHFQNISQSLGRLYEVMAFCPQPGQFATLFIDITERQQMEDRARQAAARIEVHHRLIEQREQERLRIARDLHDGPVQALIAATFTLHSLRQENCSAEMAKTLEELHASLQDQVNELRAYAGELRPPILARLGLAKAIESHLESFRKKHPGLQLTFDDRSSGPVLPEPDSNTFFRIYQESLANIVRHARATEVTIRLSSTDGQVALEIQDNGVGFGVPSDWLELARQGHLGLVGMRERAEAAGGSLTVVSQPGQGTCIEIVIPVQARDAFA
jgi:PAS domain S-box-containing protein